MSARRRSRAVEALAAAMIEIPPRRQRAARAAPPESGATRSSVGCDRHGVVVDDPHQRIVGGRLQSMPEMTKPEYRNQVFRTGN